MLRAEGWGESKGTGVAVIAAKEKGSLKRKGEEQGAKQSHHQQWFSQLGGKLFLAKPALQEN